MRYLLYTIIILCLLSADTLIKRTVAGEKTVGDKIFKVFPIGKVKKEKGKTLIIIFKKYQAGLLGLERNRFITVLYWFDKNDTPEKRSRLQVHLRGKKKNPLVGVFASHAPFRPNLIAVSRCKIISIKENIIEVEYIDAFNNTPVIDLKGDYLKHINKAE